MKTTNENKQKATFADLLSQYEQYASNPNADRTASPLQTLAKAVTFSVMKKCIHVSANTHLMRERQALARDLQNLDRLAYATEHATATRYNANGDSYTEITDEDLNRATGKLIRQTLGNGCDLVQDAIVAILDETNKAKERNGGTLPPAFMETPYTVRRLNRKVWIKLEDSVGGWETADTAPIKEVYRAIRRSIEQNRAIWTDPRNGYTYIADVSKDHNSDAGEVIYRRFGKYADLGGAVVDANGRETAYTADEQTARDTEELVASLGLTARQAKVLSLRQSGYGEKAIAKYLGVSKQAIQKTLKQMQTKAIEKGLKK